MKNSVVPDQPASANRLLMCKLVQIVTSHLAEEEKAGCFTSLCANCHVAVTVLAMGLSVICDSGHTHF